MRIFAGCGMGESGGAFSRIALASRLPVIAALFVFCLFVSEPQNRPSNRESKSERHDDRNGSVIEFHRIDFRIRAFAARIRVNLESRSGSTTIGDQPSDSFFKSSAQFS